MAKNLQKAIKRFDKRYKKAGGYKKFKHLIEKGETLEKIGQIYGFTRQYASLKKIDFGLEQPVKPFQTREWLQQNYCIEKRNVKDLAEECGVNPGTIYTYVRRFKLPRRGVPSGARHHRWKGGCVIRGNGNILITAGRDKGKYLHRAVMERHLGRPLKRYERVIHIDGDKSHNEVSNLRMVMSKRHLARMKKKGKNLAERENGRR